MYQSAWPASCYAAAALFTEAMTHLARDQAFAFAAAVRELLEDRGYL